MTSEGFKWAIGTIIAILGVVLTYRQLNNQKYEKAATQARRVVVEKVGAPEGASKFTVTNSSDLPIFNVQFIQTDLDRPEKTVVGKWLWKLTRKVPYEKFADGGRPTNRLDPAQTVELTNELRVIEVVGKGQSMRSTVFIAFDDNSQNRWLKDPETHETALVGKVRSA